MYGLLYRRTDAELLNVHPVGEIWNVMIPFKKKGAVMIVGIDTYHDSASKGFQVGAVVSSYNESLTRWYSKHTRQKNHYEFCQVSISEHMSPAGTFN